MLFFNKINTILLLLIHINFITSLARAGPDFLALKAGPPSGRIFLGQAGYYAVGPGLARYYA